MIIPRHRKLSLFIKLIHRQSFDDKLQILPYRLPIFCPNCNEEYDYFINVNNFDDHFPKPYSQHT